MRVNFRSNLRLTINILIVIVPFLIAYKIRQDQINIENVEAVKEALRKGYYECKERWENKESTKFTDIPSFFLKYDDYEIKRNPYTKIKKIKHRFGREKITETISDNSCFESTAIPKSDKNTWFKYVITEYDTKEYGDLKIKVFGLGGTGLEMFKGIRGKFTCGDSSKKGCTNVNYW